MNTEVHFSSKRVEHETPGDFFKKLNNEFHFTTDVCALPENAKCEHYYTTAKGMEYECLWPGKPELDGLNRDWSGVCWMNPPYGDEISKWVRKARNESAKFRGATVVSLLPARTDTKWWHEWIYERGYEVRFIKGRLKFSGHKNSAPFPSAVVIFTSTPK